MKCQQQCIPKLAADLAEVIKFEFRDLKKGVA
jgi:hypothetical protein